MKFPRETFPDPENPAEPVPARYWGQAGPSPSRAQRPAQSLVITFSVGKSLRFFSAKFLVQITCCGMCVALKHGYEMGCTSPEGLVLQEMFLCSPRCGHAWYKGAGCSSIPMQLHVSATPSPLLEHFPPSCWPQILSVEPPPLIPSPLAIPPLDQPLTSIPNGSRLPRTMCC